MFFFGFRQHWLEYSIIGIWTCNCLIASIIAVRESWIPNMDAGTDSYLQVHSDAFDGTTMPISYIPDWSKTQNQDKTKKFEDIAIGDYIPLPTYEASLILKDTLNLTKNATILHYTYITPYMGSYRLNYLENDGSHLGVDIRSPIGTPVLSIANGVVVRTTEADATGNRFVVIRHDQVPINGVSVSLYSSYLHLSQITATEGKKIQKGEMLGRVGMSGITTTPHLHLQIDTAEAPFHPYWPFTNTDSRNAGLGFFDSVNQGLGKENAKKYTIHPMNFINTYLGGVISPGKDTPTYSSLTKTVITENLDNEGQLREREMLLGAYTSEEQKECIKNRFTDIPEGSKMGKMLYSLVDERCLFQKDGTFAPRESISLREAVISIMDYYQIKGANGTSNFLDIAIGDELQGYAMVLYRRGIVDGNYFYPDKILTKAETVDLLVKISGMEENPSSLQIYSDISVTNPYFKSIQAYGLKIHARGGRFSGDSILTRGSLVSLLSSIDKISKK